jgi:hypothetical protein
MGLNFIPRYPEFSPPEPATARQPVEDLFPQDDLFSLDDGATDEGDAPIWWILGLAICVLPWLLGMALISAL